VIYLIAKIILLFFVVFLASYISWFKRQSKKQFEHNRIWGKGKFIDFYSLP